MSKNYTIKTTPVDVLIKRAKVYGRKDTLHLIYHQVQKLKEKNRNINYLIKINKLEHLIRSWEKHNEKEFYIEFLKELKLLQLNELEEYNALVFFLEGLVQNNHNR